MSATLSKIEKRTAYTLLLPAVILVFAIVIIVSYLPSRRIAKMKPTDALRGKTVA